MNIGFGNAVIPAQAGIPSGVWVASNVNWTPAFAGVTKEV